MKVFLCYLQRRNQLHYLARHIPCCSGVWMRLPNTSQRPGGNACDCRSEIWCASSTSSLSPGEALSILASHSTSRRRQHVYCPRAQALHQQLQSPPGIVLAPATHYFRAREWCSQRHEIAPHAPACPVDYPCARADSRANSHDGSELFIVDVWSLNKSRPVNPGDPEPAPGVLVTCEPKPCQLRLLFNQSSSCAATLLMTVCV